MHSVTKAVLAVLVVVCLFQAASAITVAAKDSTATAKSGAAYICTGVNDQTVIQKAIASNKYVTLQPGTYYCSGPIRTSSGTVLAGSGSGSTRLHFTQGGILVTMYPDASISGLTITGKGMVYITKSRVTLRDVVVSGVDNSQMGCFVVDAYGQTIEKITFDNCKAINPARWGFVHTGAGPSSSYIVKDVVYTNCIASGCGRYGHYYGQNHEYPDAWDVGFDISEYVNVRNITYRGCIAEYSWTTGFHTESITRRTDVRLIDCISRYNGQKVHSGVYNDRSLGAGYIINTGMTLTNCVSDYNIQGFLGSGASLVNCRATNTLGYPGSRTYYDPTPDGTSAPTTPTSPTQPTGDPSGIAPTITVTSPNGGQTWSRGTSHQISWTFKGTPGSQVNVMLLRGSTNAVVSTKTVPIGSSGSGSCSFTIPTSVAAGTTYKIGVKSTTQTSIKDTSNSYFRIS